MKQIVRNLLTTAMIETDDAEYMIKLIEEQPNSQLVESRSVKAWNHIAHASGMLKALKMIICDHDNGKGDTTGIAWHQTFDDKNRKIQSYKEVTKRCCKCNQVFYRKKYNLLGRKKK